MFGAQCLTCDPSSCITCSSQYSVDPSLSTFKIKKAPPNCYPCNTISPSCIACNPSKQCQACMSNYVRDTSTCTFCIDIFSQFCVCAMFSGSQLHHLHWRTFLHLMQLWFYLGTFNTMRILCKCSWSQLSDVWFHQVPFLSSRVLSWWRSR
jgi:hypothetical protein